MRGCGSTRGGGGTQQGDDVLVLWRENGEGTDGGKREEGRERSRYGMHDSITVAVTSTSSPFFSTRERRDFFPLDIYFSSSLRFTSTVGFQREFCI